MRMHHTPSHWVVVALVLMALLLTLREAHGQAQTQSPGAAAVFEGRPAMAGAQAGLGAQAGPPQGGIGVQGPEAAERGLRLRRPGGASDMPQGPAASTEIAAANAPAGQVAKPKDTGIARDQRSAVRKTKRAAKRTIRRARTGTAEIDAH